MDYYKNNQLSFQDGAKALVSLYFFNSERDAVFNSNYLKMCKSPSIDTLQQKGLAYCQIKQSISYDEDTLDKNVISTIFNLADNEISFPIQTSKNEFVVINKHKESGHRIKSFDEVEPAIRQILKDQHIEQAKQMIYKKLKTKYKIINKHRL